MQQTTPFPRLMNHFKNWEPENKIFKTSDFVDSFNEKYSEQVPNQIGSQIFWKLKKENKIVKIGKCYWMFKDSNFDPDVWVPKDKNGKVITYDILAKDLGRFLKLKGIKFPSQKLPFGYVNQLLEEYHGVSYKEMQTALKRLSVKKRSTPVTLKTEYEVTSYMSLKRAGELGNIDYRQNLLNCRLYRSSTAEKNCCIKMGKLLSLGDVPTGGSALLMGTPTGICAAPDSVSRLLFIDNTGVASALLFTTDYMRIVIGNLMDPEKAKVKVAQWKNFDLFHHVPIEEYPLDAQGFYDKVTEMINAGNKFLKVVFLSSGVWHGKQEKKFNFNFHDAAEQLSNENSRLHLLAMVRSHPSFDIHYLHMGKTKIYKTS